MAFVINRKPCWGVLGTPSHENKTVSWFLGFKISWFHSFLFFLASWFQSVLVSELQRFKSCKIFISSFLEYINPKSFWLNGSSDFSGAHFSNISNILDFRKFAISRHTILKALRPVPPIRRKREKDEHLVFSPFW